MSLKLCETPAHNDLYITRFLIVNLASRLKKMQEVLLNSEMYSILLTNKKAMRESIGGKAGRIPETITGAIEAICDGLGGWRN